MADQEARLSAFITAASKLSALHTAVAQQRGALSEKDFVESLFPGSEDRWIKGVRVRGYVLPADFVNGCARLAVPINQIEVRCMLEALPFDANGIGRTELIAAILAAPTFEEEPHDEWHGYDREPPPAPPPVPAELPEPPAVAPPAPKAELPAPPIGSWTVPEPPASGLSREQQFAHFTRQSRSAPWAVLDVSQAPMFSDESVRSAGARPSNRRPPSAAEAADAARRAGKGAAGRPAVGVRSAHKFEDGTLSTLDGMLQVRPATAPTPRRSPPPPPFALDEYTGPQQPAEPLPPRPTLPTLARVPLPPYATLGSVADRLPKSPRSAQKAAPYATLSPAELATLEDLDARERRWRPTSHAIGPLYWEPEGGGATIDGSRVVQKPPPEAMRGVAAGVPRHSERDLLGVVPRDVKWQDGALLRPNSARGRGSCHSGQISQISFG